ncbi:MAG: hypothetical protein WBV73_21990 [Phormidium sp.]
MNKFQKAGIGIVLTSIVFPWLGVQVNQAATPVAESFPVVAQATALNLTQPGSGQLKIGKRRTRSIKGASVMVRPNGTVDLGLTYADGSGTLRFGGRLVSQTGDTLTLALTNSGNADASGEVTVSYGPSNSINWISGSGFVDGQPLTIEFSSGSQSNVGSQPMNLSQTGSGLFTLQGRPNRGMSRALVTVQPNGKAEIVFLLADGNQMRFSGDLANKDAQTLNIRVTSSGMADASGNIRVEYGPNNSINTIFGGGKLDGQDFSVQFSR